MKQVFKAAIVLIFAVSLCTLGHANNAGSHNGIGCGDLHIGLSSTPNIGLSAIAGAKGDDSKNGVVYEGPFCTNTSTFITVSFNGIIDGGNELKGDDSKGPSSSLSSNAIVKVIAIPSDEFGDDVTNLFDCGLTSETNGITRIQRPRIIDMPYGVSLAKEDISKHGPSDNIILLGEIPVSELRRQEIFYGGILYRGVDAINMFNSFTAPDGWPIVTPHSGMFIGLIDLSPLSPGSTYRLVAYVCEEAVNGPVACPYINYNADAKEDNSKNTDEQNSADFNGALFAAIPFATNDADDCPEFALDPSFTDPCDCSDPLNAYDGGQLVLYHDVLEIGDAAGEDWILVLPAGSPTFFLDPEGDIEAASGTQLVDNGDGTYTLDVWHVSGVGWSGIIQNANNPNESFMEANSCDVDVCPLIPSMGQWSLFILGLILSCLAVVFVGFKQKASA